MTIDVLVCRNDGTQLLERREVAEDWLPTAPWEAVTGRDAS